MPEDFQTPALRLRYDTSKPWGDTTRRARWQILRSTTGYLQGDAVMEDDVPVERALEIAELLGVREEAVNAMRREAEALSTSSRGRLQRSREERATAEEIAVKERHAADHLRATIKRVA